MELGNVNSLSLGRHRPPNVGQEIDVLRIQPFRESESISRICDGIQSCIRVRTLKLAELGALAKLLPYVGSPVGSVRKRVNVFIKFFQPSPGIVNQISENLSLCHGALFLVPLQIPK